MKLQPCDTRGALRTGVLLALAAIAALAPTRLLASRKAPKSRWSLAQLKRTPAPHPRCFAFSPKWRAYACYGLFTDRSSTVRTGFVDLVGFRGGKPWVESLRIFDTRRRPLVPRSAVKRKLRPFRVGSAELRSRRLTPGKWVTVGALAFRLNVRLHEGDASYEYFGEAQLRCTTGRIVTIDVRARGVELGDHARLFWSRGSGLWALTVHGNDGGEGYVDNFLDTVVIDVRATCAGTLRVAGPRRRL